MHGYLCAGTPAFVIVRQSAAQSWRVALGRDRAGEGQGMILNLDIRYAMTHVGIMGSSTTRGSTMDAVRALARSQGVVHARDLEPLGAPRAYLTRLVAVSYTHLTLP